MKAKILTIALLAATFGCYAEIANDIPRQKPEHALEAIRHFGEIYGKKSEKTVTIKRNQFDDSVESEVTILPFECPVGLLTNIKNAFNQDKDLCYEMGLYEPGYNGTYKTYTGKTRDQYIWTKTKPEQGIYYMNFINDKNPELRDQITLVWEVVYETTQVKDFHMASGWRKEVTGSMIEGKIFFITSLRPDLVEKNDKRYTFPFSSSNSEPDIDTIAVDTCYADSIVIHDDFQEIMDKITDGKYKWVMQKKTYDIDKWAKNRGKLPDGLSISKDVAGWSPAAMTKQNSVEMQLNAYKQLLEMQDDQIKNLQRQYRDNPTNYSEKRSINKRLRKLHKQAQKTTDKMEKLIKKLH